MYPERDWAFNQRLKTEAITRNEINRIVKGYYLLAADVAIAATSATLNLEIPLIAGGDCWIIIDPYTAEAENRLILTKVGRTITFAALT